MSSPSLIAREFDRRGCEGKVGDESESSIPLSSRRGIVVACLLPLNLGVLANCSERFAADIEGVGVC